MPQRSLNNALAAFVPGSPQAAIEARKKRPRKRKPAAPRAPRRAELQYAQGILRLFHALSQDARTLLLPAVQDLFARRDGRRADGVSEDVGAIVARMMARFQRPRPAAVRALAENTARSAANHAEKQLGRALGYVPTVNPLVANKKLASRAQVFVSENMTLISSLPERYAEALSAKILRAYEDGTSYGDLAADISTIADVVGYDAYRIARDQIGKLVADVRQERTQELGITQYVWRTVKDSRVRDEHDALDGQVFDYAGPGAPGEGHPGDAIMCRCYDEPKIYE